MCRGTAVPLSALLASSALAILLAAQTTLSCTDKLAVPMSDEMMNAMPGMDMSGMQGPHAMMICPVVLALIIASAFLTSVAFATLVCDPHRTLSQRAIVRALSRLPPARTAGVVGLAGASAVGAMIFLERSGLPALPTCATLALLLCGCSLVVTVVAISAGRLAIALGRRVMLAIAAAISALVWPAAPRAQRFVPALAAAHDLPLLAAGRGLRAPPPLVH